MTEPEEKPLRTASFVVHATRGVIRDQSTRRKVMFALIAIALLFLVAGLVFLQSPLDPRAHPIWFILFWIVCGWLTLTSVLLAVFDLLMVRMEARKTERSLREKFVESQTPELPGSTTPKQSELAKPFGVDE